MCDLSAKTIDRPLNDERQVAQANGNVFPAQGLVRPEHNLGNHINGFAVCRPCIVDGCPGLNSPRCDAIVFTDIGEGRFLNNQVGRRRCLDLISYIKIVESEQGPDGDDELMLVGNIELMKRVEYVVPARIRLQSAEFLDDFFAGELYLSMRERTFKTVRLSAKRKLDVPGTGRIEWADDIPRQMIQRGSQIVNCIANDEGEMWWNGRIYVNAQGAHAGVGIILDEKFRLGFPVELLGERYKILDVMLGPL